MIHTLALHTPACTLGAIVLIAAPFVGEGGWPADEWEPQRELGAKLPGEVPVFLVHGLSDETVPPAHVELYAGAISHAHVVRLPGRDHQLNNDLAEVAKVIRWISTGP